MKTWTTQLGAFALSAATIFLDSECASATTWQNGDLTTYSQGIWGNPATNAGAMLLLANFDTVYQAAGGVIAGSSSGFTMTFTDATSVIAYMPSVGSYAALNSSVLNPDSGTTSSGAFGGDVMALTFNVDFSDAGLLLPDTSGLRFGDLILANFTGALAPLDGLTVRQFLGDMNTLLSGGSSIVTIADLGTTLSDLNASFFEGSVLPFAQDHLDAPEVLAVPLPATLPLFATGLVGLGLLGWRRKRKAQAAA